MEPIATLKGIILSLFLSPGQAIPVPSMPDCDKVRSSDEVVCTACNIYHEARGETHDGKIAVANVTRNRVDSDRFPDNFCKVVWQRRQFSWTKDGRSDKVRDSKAWEESYLISVIVVKSYRRGFMYFNDMTHGSIFYHADWSNPVWRTNQTPAAVIGRHIFYKNAAQADDLKKDK